MQPNHSPLQLESETPNAQAAEPLLEIIDDVVPAEVHAAAWETCRGKGWYFGHGSNENEVSQFWKMDLEKDAAYDRIWELVRERCEALAGSPLRVIRQYANGHTYGLGGNPHLDDHRPGTYTFLYYPNLEWKDGWDGETVFFDPGGEISFAVRPKPNRGVFFDSRILHAGRAPSRSCHALRVTVAYKLEAVGGSTVPSAEHRPVANVAAPPAPAQQSEEAPIESKKIRQDGATHVYSIRVPSSAIQRSVQKHLETLAGNVRLPGFRPGKIPAEVMEQRYGAQARSETLRRIGAVATERTLPKGSIAGVIGLKAGADSGDLEFEVTATHLPELPDLDLSKVVFERLTAAPGDLESLAIMPENASIRLREHLKSQVLDQVDAAYRFPILPMLIEREFSSIWKAAQAQAEIPADEIAQTTIQFRGIAERRLRLGLMVAELARRHEIKSKQAAELEEQLIDFLLSRAVVQERQATPGELRELLKD